MAGLWVGCFRVGVWVGGCEGTRYSCSEHVDLILKSCITRTIGPVCTARMYCMCCRSRMHCQYVLHVVCVLPRRNCWSCAGGGASRRPRCHRSTSDRKSSSASYVATTTPATFMATTAPATYTTSTSPATPPHQHHPHHHRNTGYITTSGASGRK